MCPNESATGQSTLTRIARNPAQRGFQMELKVSAQRWQAFKITGRACGTETKPV